MIGAIVTVKASGFKVIPEYSEFTLSNGLRVVLIEDHHQPMVDLRMLFGTGSSTDSSRLSGLAAVSVEMLKEGTEGFPGEALAAAVDSTGGVLDFRILQDGMIIEGSFLSRDLRFALEILAEMSIRPVFEEENLERLKKRYTSMIMQVNSVPSYRLRNTVYRSVYGDIGYGLPLYGDRSGIRRINLEDVTGFYQKNFRPNNAALIVAGDLKSDKTKDLIKKLFSGWRKGKDFSESIINVNLPDSLRIIILDNPDAPSTEFMIGRPAVPLGAEHAILDLLNYIMGGAGDISRLSQRLVHDKALAVRVGSKIDWSREEGMLRISGVTANEMAAESIRQVFSTIAELRDIRVPARELENAKNFFRGYLPGFFETTDRSANVIAELLCFGVSLDYYENMLEQFELIDPDALREAAREFLDEKNLTVIIAGPESILRQGLSDLAPVEVISSDQN